MTITKLRIGGFGKLQNVDIDLCNGINLIEGGNESGKSTVHSFVRAMLFGLEPKKRLEYSRYIPRDIPGNYQGSMDFEHNGHNYRIYRNFLKGSQSCVFTDLDTGEELPANTDITMIMPEMTENAYRNTIAPSQTEMKPDREFDNDVGNLIANLTMAKTSEVDVAGALNRIKNQNKKLEDTLFKDDTLEQLRSKKTGLEKLYGQIDECNGKIREQTEKYKRASDEEKSVLAEVEAIRGEAGKIETELPGKTAGTARFIAGVSFAVLAAGIIAMLIFSGSSGAGVLAAALLTVAGSVGLAVSVIKKKEQDRTAGRLSECNRREAEKRRLLAEKTEARYLAENELTALKTRLEMLGEPETEPEELEQQIEEAREARDQAKFELNAGILAFNTMSGLSDKIYRSFGEKLNEGLADTAARLTGGVHSDVIIKDRLMPASMEKLDYITAEGLSTGTSEQLYLALRLTLAELFFKDEKVMLMFDEPFAYYDDRRVKEALKLFMGQNSQIVLFSCTGREKRLLDELGATYRYFYFG